MCMRARALMCVRVRVCGYVREYGYARVCLHVWTTVLHFILSISCSTSFMHKRVTNDRLYRSLKVNKNISHV